MTLLDENGVESGSSSSRRTWIEIYFSSRYYINHSVVLLAEDVD